MKNLKGEASGGPRSSRQHRGVSTTDQGGDRGVSRKRSRGSTIQCPVTSRRSGERNTDENLGSVEKSEPEQTSRTRSCQDDREQ